jgi:dihydrodipicolinate synthase/N-acetylneuraminate lyase
MLLLADYAEMVGFDLLITSPPSIGAKTEEQVTDYVELLANKTSLAIMFYNTPQFGLVMSPQGLQRICQIPNVVGVKEASFNQTLSLETHQLIGKEAIISTPDEWIFFKEEELGFHQQVMFANTSDWRFDTPDANYYVQFIEKATKGDIDRNFYNRHLKNIKAINDKWWSYQVQKFGGLLPASMCKYWGTLMGLKHGPVRSPLREMTSEEKAELKSDLQNIRLETMATGR